MRRRRDSPKFVFYQCRECVGKTVRVSVDVALVTLTCAVLNVAAGRLKQLNLNTQTQSVRGCASEVVVCLACTMTTTSMLQAVRL